MPTIFSHALVGGLIAQAGPESLRRRPSYWVAAAFCAIAADADVAGWAKGIRYGDLWGHRGLSHSLVFAVGLGVVVSLLFWRRVREGNDRLALALLFILAAASHAFLDAMTNGGLGVAFFSPLDTTRYFLPWRPIDVSPIGTAFFSAGGLRVLINEAKWIIGPALATMALIGFRRRNDRA